MKPHTFNQISLTLLRYIAELKISHEAKHILLFLCSWAEINYSGIGRASFDSLAYFTGMETGKILKGFKELERAGEIINGKEPDWLFVVNKWSMEPSVGEKVAIGVWNSLARNPIDMVSAFKNRYGNTYSIPIPYPSELEPTETETEKDTDTCPAKSPDGSQSKKPKGKKRTYEDWLKSDDPAERIVGHFVKTHLDRWGFKPRIPFSHVFPNTRILLKRGITEEQIKAAMDAFIALDPDQCDDFQRKWVLGHKWEMFIKHVDELITSKRVIPTEESQLEFLDSQGVKHD